MKKIIVLLLSCFIMPSIILAGNFKVDPAHSNIGFTISHLVIATVRGQFNIFAGDVDFDIKTKELRKLTAKINTVTIDTNQLKRDKHLRSPDFFDVKKFPIIHFESQSITRTGDDYQVTGKLTIKNVTKQVVLKGKLLGIIKDDRGNDIVGFTAEGQIDRYDYGLTYNKLLEMGGLSIGRTVKIVLDIQLNSK